MAMDAGLKKQIDGLLEEAEKGSLLQSMEKIYAILRDHGLMWSSTIHSRWIGVHESNRDGTGISPDHVQKLCLDFFEFGYVPSASRRICIELGTGDRCSDDTRAYNDKLVQQSNNLLLWLLIHVLLHCVHFHEWDNLCACHGNTCSSSPCMAHFVEVAAHQGKVAFCHHSWVTFQSSDEDVVLWNGACK